jgi:hypothetical protein
MASVYGYVVLIVGLSLLLGFAGVETGMGVMLGKYVSFDTIGDGHFNASTINVDNLNVGDSSDGSTGSDSLSWLWAAFGLGAILVGGIALVTKDVGQGIKAGFAVIGGVLILADFRALLILLSNASGIGTIFSIVPLFIYVPLAIGFIITLINWIGGGQ